MITGARYIGRKNTLNTTHQFSPKEQGLTMVVWWHADPTDKPTVMTKAEEKNVNLKYDVTGMLQIMCHA